MVSKDTITLAQIRLNIFKSNQDPSETFERCLRGKSTDDQDLASHRLEGQTGEKSKSLDLEKIEVQVSQTLIGAAESSSEISLELHVNFSRTKAHLCPV